MIPSVDMIIVKMYANREFVEQSDHDNVDAFVDCCCIHSSIISVTIIQVSGALEEEEEEEEDHGIEVSASAGGG